MKLPLILVSLFILIHQQAFSQTNNFAPIGATWYYSDIYDIDYDDTLDITGYNKVESIADTTIGGINCRELKFSFVNPTGGLESELMHYVYENNEKVYFLIGDKFKLVYDFSGADWFAHDVYYNFGDSTLIEVDSVTMELYDGVLLKTIHTHINFDYDFFYVTNKIVETIGPLGYMFLYHGTDDSFPPSGLRCYTDDAHDIQISESLPCDSLTPEITAINQIKNELGINVYPNPSNGAIYVDCSNINSNDNNIIIIDITGKQIYSSQLTAQVINKIEISSIPNGLYIAQIKNENGAVDSFKIVKEL